MTGTHADLQQIYARVSENEQETAKVQIDVGALKVSVNNIAGGMDRIERKLDTPAIGPSWVAITSLFVSISAVIGGAVIGFVVLTNAPLRETQAQMRAQMQIDDQREELETAKLAIHDTILTRLMGDRDNVYTILGKIRSEERADLRRTIVELNKDLNRARGQ